MSSMSHPVRRSFLLLAVAALVFAPLAARKAGASDTITSTALARSLDRLIDAARIPDSKIGVAVLERGRNPGVAYARGHTRALVPASVAKLLTAASALDHLGPAHVFTTRVTARGPVEGGVLRGDLVVHGSGDPSLSGRFFDGDALAILRGLAREVRAAGITDIEGQVILDDLVFDREYVHPSWSNADKARWYGAGVGGLAFNDGCADVEVEGARRVGTAAVVRVPSTLGPWRLESKVSTVANGNPTVGGLWVGGGERLRVQGRIAAGKSYRFHQPVPDPVAFLGGAFVAALRTAGVSVPAGHRLATGPDDAAPGRPIAQHGTPLDESLAVMNKQSQNFYAASLFKAAGAAVDGQGTWASGELAVAEMLRRRGIHDGVGGKAGTRIVDGSGLSLENRATAASVARLLLSLEQDMLRGPMFLCSLAVPGEDGTLERRLVAGGVGARLRAKTGTLGRSGVHALAGYVDGRDGHPGFAFAIFLNTSRGGRALIDDLVREIAKS